MHELYLLVELAGGSEHEGFRLVPADEQADPVQVGEVGSPLEMSDTRLAREANVNVAQILALNQASFVLDEYLCAKHVFVCEVQEQVSALEGNSFVAVLHIEDNEGLGFEQFRNSLPAYYFGFVVDNEKVPVCVDDEHLQILVVDGRQYFLVVDGAGFHGFLD